ncbi:MAG TPA: 4-hydroxy-tetrahydrodipicolinate reductase [Marinilabiliales bacterium]|nr:MAG: 4-hydroxy-tetrahydrodipicolinate reductase [Bacteroidetes bacterium GWA2_40_14]OFX61084.1 MAG: 4-hydroxy-tetrahydrodipicolinate reductase [Bacteroidetes bacterium GWC2_40_13]OFX72687.1 MAG: 4-hydroxy-tetrahydrodipicolinate reductase [Bacteroidetes bacterium GWD2_40_43]OFX91317.1 MAG: 4-hydroxy-tetrahydrodipicolinate reductase [Bacteroidetes bacterium GWE2_40_63]OFY19387.1 MAG: 4-hydroxy-tetrahydrodipicolinate reductase [Bacteroidetes bacterium GWF2_40_13]OFZ26039.1 MAG: 4-hydroxy-tetra
MNLALIGYGQMGKEIEKIALERGHQIKLIVDKDNQGDLNEEKLSEVDVAIEFSRPESAFENYKKCFQCKVPVVSGTTGWLEKLPEVISICEKNQTGFFYASNFSLGVNLFFQLNRHLAKQMAPFTDYRLLMNEIHHIRKLDAPSGTAITLAEGIMAENPVKKSWCNHSSENSTEIPIISFREGEIPGTHEIIYDSQVDTILIKHEAKSRKGFALGTVVAAEFMQGKIGFYGMNDLLKLNE